MKKVNKTPKQPTRKGLLLNDRDFKDIAQGGTFELERGRDFDCAPSTAQKYMLEELRARHGAFTVTSDPKNDAVTVTFTPATVTD